MVPLLSPMHPFVVEECCVEMEPRRCQSEQTFLFISLGCDCAFAIPSLDSSVRANRCACYATYLIILLSLRLLELFVKSLFIVDGNFFSLSLLCGNCRRKTRRQSAKSNSFSRSHVPFAVLQPRPMNAVMQRAIQRLLNSENHSGEGYLGAFR